ncbi:MAG: VOC family protein [Spirochaetes bacterium]|nr:VOC family protein [Spirochaetota bacterium]
MKRAIMQLYVNGSFEAVELYLKAFNAVLGFNVMTPDNKAYYHAELNICGNILAISEINSTDNKIITGNTMQFAFHYGKENADKLKQAYDILKDNGKIIFPLGPCDYSLLMTDIIDKFGVRWCLFE